MTLRLTEYPAIAVMPAYCHDTDSMSAVLYGSVIERAEHRQVNV